MSMAKVQNPLKKAVLAEAARRDLIPGGKGDKLQVGDVDPVELKRGTGHEFEHTRDPLKAQEIALDHLAENPHYYRDLKAAKIEHQTHSVADMRRRLTDDIARAACAPYRAANLPEQYREAKERVFAAQRAGQTAQPQYQQDDGSAVLNSGAPRRDNELAAIGSLKSRSSPL